MVIWALRVVGISGCVDDFTLNDLNYIFDSQLNFYRDIKYVIQHCYTTYYNLTLKRLINGTEMHIKIWRFNGGYQYCSLTISFFKRFIQKHNVLKLQ